MTSYIKSKFRRCKVEDFYAHGHREVYISAEYKKQIEKRICPDTEALGDNFILKNDYTNLTERKSFQLEITMCKDPHIKTNAQNPFGFDRMINLWCKSPENIAKVLKEIYFTLYVMVDESELGKKDNLGKSPMHNQDKFHS